ncbi:MAG TPA: copper chaperone PCu(A)C [Rhizomicrobium sp.]|jgi:copper(I)-binding protein|nr:copper chaperone PCu(A)C [Rhizomicrobium sp.]
MRVKPVEILLAVLLSAAPAAAAEVEVSDAWIRALPAKLPAAGYFTIRNRGGTDIRLTGAKSPACGSLMLHQSKEMGGVGSMREVSEVTIAAGGDFRFLPGGFHLMCMEPSQALKPGASVTVTLEFSDGSETAVKFAVRDAQGR